MTILHWCDSSCTQHPLPPDYASLERHVREQRDKEQEKENLIRVSQKELLDVVADNPPIIFSHATTELGPRVNHFNSRAQSQQGSSGVADKLLKSSGLTSPTVVGFVSEISS
ncbi:hypothetical protein JHK82_042740 [Glycine max]|nr:hypothetical protein JHK86_042767 [Glycine max]KAG4957021.1 hypothetical protein JHK85_043401 [Glycine max]KAG5105770.1 hypothetical protein JHK82_042740 [Glycine max]